MAKSNIFGGNSMYGFFGRNGKAMRVVVLLFIMLGGLPTPTYAEGDCTAAAGRISKLLEAMGGASGTGDKISILDDAAGFAGWLKGINPVLRANEAGFQIESRAQLEADLRSAGFEPTKPNRPEGFTRWSRVKQSPCPKPTPPNPDGGSSFAPSAAREVFWIALILLLVLAGILSAGGILRPQRA